jgi:glycosyltransferase involved in cell wall biosynthesis
LKAVVCLPTYNERENVERIVRALAQRGVSVLVIDDSSPDGTGELADRPAAELERREVATARGKPAGRTNLSSQGCIHVGATSSQRKTPQFQQKH